MPKSRASLSTALPGTGRRGIRKPKLTQLSRVSRKDHTESQLWPVNFIVQMQLMTSNQKFLQHLYDAFNGREIETIISSMRPDVKWANGLDGGFVYGRD